MSRCAPTRTRTSGSCRAGTDSSARTGREPGSDSCATRLHVLEGVARAERARAVRAHGAERAPATRVIRLQLDQLPAPRHVAAADLAREPRAPAQPDPPRHRAEVDPRPHPLRDVGPRRVVRIAEVGLVATRSTRDGPPGTLMLYAPLASVRTSAIFVMFAPGHADLGQHVQHRAGDRRPIARQRPLQRRPPLGERRRHRVPPGPLDHRAVAAVRRPAMHDRPHRRRRQRRPVPGRVLEQTPIDRVPSGSVAVSNDTVVPTSSGHGCGHLNEFGSAGSTCTHRPDESGTTADPTSFPSAVTTTRYIPPPPSLAANDTLAGPAASPRSRDPRAPSSRSAR